MPRHWLGVFTLLPAAAPVSVPVLVLPPMLEPVLELGELIDPLLELGELVLGELVLEPMLPDVLPDVLPDCAHDAPATATNAAATAVAIALTIIQSPWSVEQRDCSASRCKRSACALLCAWRVAHG